MSKRLGNLIRQARTDAGLTQEQLARRVRGLSATDISLAERGEKELTQAELKEIAKETGVTQKSLLDAAKTGASGGKTGSGEIILGYQADRRREKTDSGISGSGLKIKSCRKNDPSGERWQRGCCRRYDRKPDERRERSAWKIMKCILCRRI